MVSTTKGKSKLSDLAYDQLKNLILNNRFRPGEHLDEVNLCSMFNVSRTPLREAINRLVYENLLVSVPQKGIFVPELTIQSISELFQARKLLEPMVLNLSARYLEPKVLRQFRSETEALIKEESIEKLHEIDYEFHHYIASECRNQYLLTAYTSIEEQFQRVRTQDFYPMERAVNGAREHIIIIDNIVDQRFDALPECLLHHILSTEKYYYKKLIDFDAAEMNIQFFKEHQADTAL